MCNVEDSEDKLPQSFSAKRVLRNMKVKFLPEGGHIRFSLAKSQVSLQDTYESNQYIIQFSIQAPGQNKYKI